MESLLTMNSPVGELGIAADDAGICGLFAVRGELPSGFTVRETPLLCRAAEELNEYFRGKRKAFDLPLSLRGTPFQLADWAALQKIPYGETRSYAQLAAMIGRPRACRAVGGANGRNPVMIVVPCHRVIAADGGPGGYTGGLEIKRFLLELEKKFC